MEAENILRVLVVDESLNDAEVLISLLRKTGYAVRPTHVEDDEDLLEALQKQLYDIILINNQLEFCSIERAVEIVGQSNRDIPVIAVAKDFSEEAVCEAITQGAADFANRDNETHLNQIVQRELKNLHARRASRRSEQMYRESERRCHTLLDSSRDAITYVHEGMHVYANPIYLDMFGFSDIEEIEGTPIMDIVESNDQSRFKDLIRSYGKGDHKLNKIEVHAVKPGGGKFKALMELTPASIEGESCTQILIRDQATNQELENKIKYLSKQDLVTGLFNRQYFMEELELAVNNAVSGSDTGAVFYILFDNCKDMKETIGIAACDLVFGDFARLVKPLVDENDMVARFSDNVFIVLIHNKSLQEIQQQAESIRKSVEDHICDIGEQSINATCSIGISLVGESTTDVQEIISRADLACEVARKGGGNSVHLHNPVADEKAGKERDREWLELIRNSLTHNQFRLVFQPVVSLHGDPEERYEVLLRLIDPNGEIIQPSHFIPVAERAGLVAELDRWVIQHTIELSAQRSAEGLRTIFLVKIFGQTLEDDTLLPWLRDMLSEYRVQGDTLVFELAETSAATHLKAAKNFVRGLKELHCGFALDHFGSGLNSFNMLKHLPADYLKIDGSFIHNLAENKENQSMVKSVTEMAHSMNKLTIAEYVEDASSLTMLWQYGVNFIQGYFLQEPGEELTYDFTGETA